MTAVIQRVLNANVTVEEKIVGECGHGLLVLLGVKEGDDEKDAELLADKISKLRIFTDENDKLNLALADIGGEVLVVSNFTLISDYAHGNRPSYIEAAKPDHANRLYEYFCEKIRAHGFNVGTGIFGADMKISLVNDGPITIVMESEKLRKK